MQTDRMKRLVLMAVLVAYAALALAQASPPRPESGVWSATGGGTNSGLTITQQSDGLAIGLYTYDAEGEATWYLAVGRMEGAEFSATLNRYAGGACITCAPLQTPAQAVESRELHISFLSNTRGVMRIDDDSVPIQYFGHLGYDAPALSDIAHPYLSYVPRMLGVWTFTSAEPTSLFHLRVVFDSETVIDPPGYLDSGDYAWSDFRDTPGGTSYRLTCYSDKFSVNPGYCVLTRQVGDGAHEPLLTMLARDIGAERLLAYEGPPVLENGAVVLGEKRVYGFRVPVQPQAGAAAEESQAP